jgi:uncharacterized membrane protein
MVSLPATDIDLPYEIDLLLKDLPETQQNAVRAVLTGMACFCLWQGPLPSPGVLKAYNEAIPNGAERILNEVQRQCRHRMDLENRMIPEQHLQSRRGQVYGLVVALSFLIASFILIAMGFGVFGTIIGTVDLIALVTVFVTGRFQKEQDETANMQQ